jgi:hypothetical protein
MALMVADYCHGHHDDASRAAAREDGHDDGHDDGLCTACHAFLAYAAARLDHCPFGEDKPTCANCAIHCYKREPREFAREVMRYAGPRMLFQHPVLAVRHLLDGRIRAAHPMETRRAARVTAAAVERQPADT